MRSVYMYIIWGIFTKLERRRKMTDIIELSMPEDIDYSVLIDNNIR